MTATFIVTNLLTSYVSWWWIILAIVIDFGLNELRKVL